MAKVDYNKYLVRKPVYEVGIAAVGQRGHQAPSMTYMSDALVPGSNTYVEISWIYDVPEPNPYVFEHAHNYDEIVMHIGNDPENPESLGAEMTIEVEGQPLSFDRTTALFLPAGTKHGPLTWQKVTRPHIEMTVMLGCGDLKLASPGSNPDKQVHQR
jgi:hypothetical protein